MTCYDYLFWLALAFLLLCLVRVVARAWLRSRRLNKHSRKRQLPRNPDHAL
jgi:hypothetical protein